MADVVPEPFVRRVLETLTPWACGSELVRLGPEADSGYLVPDAHLDRIELVMSAGLGDSSGFEDAMLDRVGASASIVDGSMDRPEWLSGAHRFHRRWQPRQLATLPHPSDRPYIAGRSDLRLWTGWPAPCCS